MIAARHYCVRGRVQGVGFRYFVVENAVRLGVRGYVRNTMDGEVEVHAEGEETALAGLRVELERGPMLARVIEVVEGDAPVTGRYSSFSVRG
jgi:acylphosphatase